LELFSPKKNSPVEANPEINNLIQEASRIADQTIGRSYVGGTYLLNLGFKVTKEGRSFPLINVIDEILRLAPDEPDFLFAKAETYSIILDDETGQQLRREVLRLNPNHFDAYMREQYFKRWENIFTYPSWNVERKKILPIMLAIQKDGGYVQIVRDGLKLTLIVLHEKNRENFPPEIVDAQWKPLWVETPFGPVFTHYVMFKLPNDKIYRQEFSLNPYPLPEIHQRNGYWLIRRVCEICGIYIVVNDGEDIIHNSYFAYSDSTQSILASVKQELAKITFIKEHDTRFKNGMEWYVQNSDIEKIPY
jgi:hypothetical protein